MSNFANKTIPAIGDGAIVTATKQDARAALAYLTRHGATDLAEALGMTDYEGGDYRATSKRTVRVMRVGSLT